MTNGQVSNIIPAGTPLHTMDGRARVECESTLDAKSPFITHTLKGSNTVALPVSDERAVEGLFVGNGRITPQASTASPDQMDLSHFQVKRNYWSKILMGAPTMLDLPTDRPRSYHRSTDTSKIPIQLDAQLTQSLKKVATEYDMDLSMVVMSGWGAVLARLSIQDDIVIGYNNNGPGGPGNNQKAVNSNIWPLRLDLSGDQNISQLLERVQKTALFSLDHEGFPLDNITELAGSPLFQVALRWSQAPLHPATLVHVELELQLQEQDNEIVGNMQYYSDLFNSDTIERHIGYLGSMLRAIAADVYRPVMSVDLLSKAERDLVLGKWNETQQDYPTDLCIHHLFEQQVERTPQATALVFDGQHMTYFELNERANRLARHLIGLGVRPDSLVAICVERSFSMIVALFAVLKAGGAYVPLDPSFASERLCDIMMDANPSILVADDHGNQALGEGVLSTVTVVDPSVMEAGSELSVASGGSLTNPQVPGLTSRSLVYIVYTSGSTGKPKGVMVEHQGLANIAVTSPEARGITTSSQVLQFFSFAFDACAMDVFTTLSGGGSLHIMPDRIRMDLPRLWDYLELESISQAVLTPSVLQNCNELHRLSRPLSLIVAAEAATATLFNAMYQLFPDGRIVNGYGPTETTVSAMAWECPRGFEGDVIPIGRPIANKRVYLLNDHQQPVPMGAIGEIYIGGVGIARGYLNQPDLTTKVFLPDPFTSDKDARMYKTGDLARCLPDGNMVYLGRNDHQVKVRGFRIELGEIEARLKDHSLVQSAAVIVVGDGSERKLVAYVAAKHDDMLLQTLRSYLTSCLPDYMVPAAIVRLDSLPINSNGKLDRKALPAPDSDAFAREIYEKPRGEVETVVAQIWAEVLKLDRVSRNDNFFALGGHSLLAVQMIERLRRTGLTISVSGLFKTPTLSTLVQSLDVHRACDAPKNLITPHITTITPEMLPLITLSQTDIDRIINLVPGGVANVQDIYALSPLQEGFLFHHLFATEGDPYLPISLMAFETRQLLDRYLEAIQMVVNRHDILRTAVVHENLSTPAQVVWRQAPLSITELQLDPSNGPIVDQLKQRLDPRKHRMDLTQAPLLRLTIAQDADGRWILADQLHHLIGDHTTSDTLSSEIKTFMNGLDHTLPPPQPFRNLIAQTQLNHSQDHEGFFKEMLMDIDTPSLPFGLKDVYSQGDNVTSSRRLLPQGLNDGLRRQAKHLGVSVASLCHLAWAQVISRTSGEDRVVFGTVLFGRMNSGQGADSSMGLFINTLPFRVDLTGTVHESVLLTHARLASLLDHEHASLALAQCCSSVPRGTPLFSAILNYIHNTASKATSIDADIQHLEFQERTNYPVALSVDDFGASLGLVADVVQPINSTRVCGYMQQALESLVSALEHSPDMMAHGMNILPSDEQELLIQTWNTTQQDYPADLCIHHPFEQQVERTPDAIALVFNGQSLTYAELNERANRLAHHLIGLGAQPDNLVAICVERSFAMIVSVLAVLKAGGAYVPLDPSYPKERLAYILEDAAPAIVLVDAVGRVALSEASKHPHGEDIDSIIMIDPNDRLSSSYVNPKVLGLTSRHLAYIIYTSGSTGWPKGVMVEHQGVVNYALSRIDEFDLDTNSRVLQFTSLSFDVSVMEIFMAFFSGSSLHLLEDRIRRDRQELWGYIEQHAITQAVLPPVILQECKSCSPLNTRLTLISAGEELPATLLRVLQRLVPSGRIINEYGPTETTIIATSWRCPLDFNDSIVPIGRPISNKTTYLLDENQQPVPMGAVGELHIGGVGVARGYLNQPELTAKVFLPDPFAGDKDARMYRTGDLARYVPDGNIIFLGRNDHQIKIRGFRIELGEIEACLQDHPLVQSAAVVAMGDGGDKRLAAYVVAKPDEQLVHSLRSHLTSCLPVYMVPSAIVRLDSLPINPNGKLDRKALPVPDGDAFARQVYEPPQGEAEATVAKIWAELLHLDRVSRNDNFFALGGHSLLAVQMIERLRRTGLTIAVSGLFKASTLSTMVQSLDVHHVCDIPTNLITPHTTTITPEMLPLIKLSQTDIENIVQHVPGGVTNIQDIYSLSPLQEGIFFHHLLATEGDPYLLISFTAFETRGILDKYLEAIQLVVNRHDILRTAVLHGSLSTPVQVVWRHAPLSIQELELNPANGPILDQLKRRLDARKHRIDLTQAPLLRFTIAQDADGQWLLADQLHHLIGDHTTFDTLSIEIKAFMDGLGHTLPPPQTFRNLIAQAQSSSQDDHERFFKEMLKDIDTPSFPYGLKDVHDQGDNVTSSYRLLPQDLNDRLREQAKHLGVSVASLCHLAWAQVISHTSGEDRVVFGTVLFGRMNSGKGADSAMGLFINTLPLRVDLIGTVRESILRTHEQLASLLDHEHASLALAQRCSGVPQGTPLFSAILNYRHNTTSSDKVSVMEGIKRLEYQERDNYPLSLSVDDNGVSLGLHADVVQPFSSIRVCGYMQQALECLVSSMEHAPDTVTRELNILPEDEQELLLRTWNATQQAYSVDLCIHHLFEQQVERTPQATALVFNDQLMSYSTLNERANRLARHLIGLGVQPDSFVAICIERSFAMVVAVFAVLKAGGAYVPLDPAYASNRLRDILTDAAPSIVLADDSGRRVLGEGVLSSLTVVDPDAVVALDESESCHTPNPHVSDITPNNLAYIIYTSGSTGKPKGVMIEHGGVVSLTQAYTRICGVNQHSRFLQFSSWSFDSSVWEMMLPLSCGGSLYLLVNSIRLDRDKVWEYMAMHSITHAGPTPSFLQDGKDFPTHVASLMLVLGGEALGPTLLQNLIAQGYTVYNDLGPTETTICAISWKCPQDFTGDVVPIGRPLANRKVYILDSHQQPVPLGAIGELYIGGVGVARGYLNQPELTSKAFLPDPFSGDKDARMYKTGDLARYLPDGNIVPLGRNDFQVKVRGFRIELGEIEARLEGHPLVRSAAVITRGGGSDKQLVAYVVTKHDDHLVHTLRSHLTSCLPDYMVPAAFVRLDDLPMTTNGKLDRHRLPQPDSDAMAHQPYEPPHGTIESALATLWTELLNLDRIGRNDNFFMLGGHSLLAVRMVSKIQSLMGFKITLGTLFMAPTIADLVPHLLAAGNSQEDAFDVLLPIRPHGARLPLFCVHHVFGISWGYIGLSKHLHPDQPIYGLQARGLADGEWCATTFDDIAFDYIEQIRRIQPHGPYCLLGYSFGGKMVHTMAAHLERQGERVALLAVMDNGPVESSHASAEERSDGLDMDGDVQLFANRIGDALPEGARPYLERFKQVTRQLSQLYEHHAYPQCTSGMVLFRATVQTNPLHKLVSADAWMPHVMGGTEAFDINCAHLDMDQPAPLAEIGRVLAQKLNGIHTEETKEL
ncbi:MAG: Non-ribosomal peptide synthetase module [Benniella sp.]|nr:MAG: Non-ribosomal peptide synthetase module [Benniella sp.]